MQEWSTDTVKASDSIAFWREAVCATVLNVTPEAPRSDFRATIAGRQFGDLRFASFRSTAHTIVRDRHHLVTADDDRYLISIQQRGRSAMMQSGREFWLEPGEIGIIDGARPFQVAFPGAVSRILAVVPRETLELRAPWLRRTGVGKIAASSPFADLARRHILQLAGEEPLDPAQAHLLTDNLCNLLALATSGEDVAAAPGAAQMQAIVAFCRAHLGDPELSPQQVAAHLKISLRTLQLRFAATGTSFGRWLLESRLAACHQALSDPAQAMRGISDIAYRHGFNDLSYFSRAFRARYAETPRDLRRRMAS